MLEYLVGRACRAARELGTSSRAPWRCGCAIPTARAPSAPARSRLPSDADPVVLELALDLLRRLFTRRVALHARRRHALAASRTIAASRARCSTSARPDAAPRCSAPSTACAAATATACSCRAGRCTCKRPPRRGSPRLRAAHTVAHPVEPRSGSCRRSLRCASARTARCSTASSRRRRWCARALERGFAALALTDRDNLYLAIRFERLARAEGLRPLLGCMLTSGAHEAILLPLDRRGYAHLCELITRRRLEPDFDLVSAFAGRRTWPPACT